MVGLRRSLLRSRLIALSLAVLTLVGTGGSWHVDADDPDFASAIVLHDHSAHHERFGRAEDAQAPTHCAICHWLQLFRADDVRSARVQLAAAETAARVCSVIESIRSADRLSLPSRAPPTV